MLPVFTSILEQNETVTLYAEEDVEEKVRQKVDLFPKLHSKVELRAQRMKASELVPKKNKRQLKKIQDKSLLPLETKAFASAMTLVDRDEFARLFDAGVPIEPSAGSNSKVLLLHAKDAVPENGQLNGISYVENVEDAVENCNYVSVLYTQHNRHDHCIAVVGQCNSYHLFKHVRTEQKEGKRTIDPSEPLRLVNRGADTRFAFTTTTPSLKQTWQHWKSTLLDCFTHLDTYLAQLEPILKKIALCKTVIAMTVNRGQVELLINFVCNARAKGLDLSAVVVL